MFCPNCGDKASKKYVFCMECGEALDSTNGLRPAPNPIEDVSSSEVPAKPFKFNPLVLLAAFLVIGVVVFAVVSRDGSNVATPPSNGANQEISVDQNSTVNEVEDPFSLCCSDSSNSPSNSEDSGSVSQPETPQGNQSQAPKVVKWVPTISAMKFCVNNRRDSSCPGQPGVEVASGSSYQVDGKAIIQRLIDNNFCDPREGETGPTGSEGEWTCYVGGLFYTVWTGDRMIADKMYVLSYYKMAALDGALFFGPLQNDVIAFLGATLIDG